MSMSVMERIADISERSGMSDTVVRRVLKASRESLIESLKKGEKSTLPGIATYRVVKKQSGMGVRSRISDTIVCQLRDIDDTEEVTEDISEYIDTLQIPGLV